MNERQTVDEDGHIISVVKRATLRHILVDDLKRIVVDVGFVDKRDIDKRAVGECPSLAIILLYGLCILDDTHIGVADMLGKEVRPFLILKLYPVEPFDLVAQVGNQLLFG